MTNEEKKLAARLLRLAAERFGRHVCNDFDLKSDGGIDEPEAWKALCAEAERRNRTPNDFDPNMPAENYRTYMPDWWVMTVMAEKLEEDAEE